MFVMEFLRNRTPNLAIAALTTLVLALMMLAWSARPAHACLMSTPPPGTNSFAAAPQLRVAYDSTVYNSDGTATTTSCSFPNGIDTKGTPSGATMEVGEPRPYSSTKDCGIYGVSSSVWWKVTVGRYDLPSGVYPRRRSASRGTAQPPLCRHSFPAPKSESLRLLHACAAAKAVPFFS